MSAALLREAARLMRERAEAATQAAWFALPYGGAHWSEHEWIVDSEPTFICSTHIETERGKGDAEHIASWHPDVALAVADWLEATAREFEALGDPDLTNHPQDGRRTAALAVARAYLGGQS